MKGSDIEFVVVPETNIENMETILQPQYVEEKRGRTNLQKEIDIPDKEYYINTYCLFNP